MSKQSDRARELYGDGPRTDNDLKPIPTTIVPGKFSDGQDRMGTPRANVHRPKRPGYEHPKAQAYRENLRERPSAGKGK